MTDVKKKIRVLVVDDSSMMRHLLKDMLATDPGIEIAGVAVDPYDAREKLVALRPDVMTLDIEMPKMDGVTFLEKVMKHLPTRTVIISSLTPDGSELALRALAMGAIDVIAKPKLDLTKGMAEIAASVASRVRAAATARLLPALSASPAPASFTPLETSQKVIAAAASTGGTEALKVFLQGMPKQAPGILIVQHMPPMFTRAYAHTLKELTGLDVREAKEGDRVMAGTVLLAPGDFHMELVRNGAFYAVHLHQRPLMHGLRPSADLLFRSVAKNAGTNAVGVILTGMGFDGAAGLLEMKQAGSPTFAQDEQTCTVFGMPKEAIRLGAAEKVLPLQELAAAVIDTFREGRASSEPKAA